MIKVKLFATLRKGLGKEQDVEFYEGIKVKDVVNFLKINPEKIAIILINGVHQSFETPLNNMDKLYLFPPVGGG